MSDQSNYPPYGSSDATWQDSDPHDNYNNAPAGNNATQYSGGYGDPESDATMLLQPNHKPTFAWLVVVKGARPGQIFSLTEKPMTLGRSGKCNIPLEDRAASGEHAKVLKKEKEFVLHDLASANGTFVNGTQVYHHPLQENDRVVIGETVLVFKHIREDDLHG